MDGDPRNGGSVLFNEVTGQPGLGQVGETVNRVDGMVDRMGTDDKELEDARNSFGRCPKCGSNNFSQRRLWTQSKAVFDSAFGDDN